jgi:integrase
MTDLLPTIDRYLDALSARVVASTYQENKNTLMRLSDWVRHESQPIQETPAETIADFFRDLFSGSDRSLVTLRGDVAPVANYGAFLAERDPKILKLDIADRLCRASNPQPKAIGEQTLDGIYPEELTPDRFASRIDELLDRLRRRQFGTRRHVYAELMYDTRNKLAQVRQLDLSDIDLSEGTAVVGIPNTHLVAQIGLLSERTVELSPRTVDAIETYVAHERSTPDGDGDGALLTTKHGRASQAALRSAIVRESERVLEESRHQEDASEDQEKPAEFDCGPRRVTPNDLWKHAHLTALERG